MSESVDVKSQVATGDVPRVLPARSQRSWLGSCSSHPWLMTAWKASTAEGLLLLAWLVASAAVRVFTARGDLWLDEVWSLSFARTIAAPWQVLTAIHHDNNHPLNTLALFVAVKVAGAHASAIVYRLLALITGIAIIPLLFWIEKQTGDEKASARAWLVAVLCGSSFLAIVYSSEARGYAPAAFFGVAAFAVLRAGSVTSST